MTGNAGDGPFAQAFFDNLNRTDIAREFFVRSDPVRAASRWTNAERSPNTCRTGIEQWPRR